MLLNEILHDGMGMASNLHGTATDIVDVYQKRMVLQH